MIVESYIFAHGTTPSDCPTPSLPIFTPRPLTFDKPIPTPPPRDVSFINSALVRPIPLIESGVSIPKQEIGKPLSVPVFESTGEARFNQPFHMYLKNLLARSGLSSLIATVSATLLYAFFGVSFGSKYPFDIVAKDTSFIHSG